MPKVTTEIQKEEMAEAFKGGKSIEDIANEYGLKNLTITKYLKALLSEAEFKKIKKANLSNQTDISIQEDTKNKPSNSNNNRNKHLEDKNSLEEKKFLGYESFYEIKPLDESFDFENRRDLTSKPLKGFTIPQNIFMIIDKNIELEELYIRDFPEYSFLSEVDQKRKIIKLFSDKKLAISYCNKNQKIIKVPNGNVFSLVSQFLLKKGITRIIYDDYLLSI